MTFGGLGYAVGMAKAKDGHIMEGWTRQKELLFSQNGSHGMIFKTREGRIILAIHSPYKRYQERPVFLELEEKEQWLRVKG